MCTASAGGQRIRGPVLAVAGVLLALPADENFAAEALTASSSRKEQALEVVTVTAQRREESLQDVPISLTAFSGPEIERQQIDDLNDLQYGAPNLTIVPWPAVTTGRTSACADRSSPTAFRPLIPRSVSISMVLSIARIGGANLDLFDIERVEVLRGPQGTLFGRNTIGGAINVVPRKPGVGIGRHRDGRRRQLRSPRFFGRTEPSHWR